jgi:uncharacterized membrane protein (DUF4010 family)
MKNSWIKPIMTLLTLALLAWLLPVEPVDPWNLLSPKKIVTMVFALALIQAAGSAIARYLGPRTGAILTGFFGGLISSTATTASLARRSKVHNNSNSAEEILIFLSATGAMLFEGVVVILTGTTDVEGSTLVIFLGPILATAAMIFVQYRKLTDRNDSTESTEFQILPLLKLSVFIVAILAFSKLSQRFFGQDGLFVLTSLVSLFEIHGSLIANVQLYESGAIPLSFLSSLLTTSVIASYVSKLFLIFTLGSSALRVSALKCTFILFGF